VGQTEQHFRIMEEIQIQWELNMLKSILVPWIIHELILLLQSFHCKGEKITFFNQNEELHGSLM
jgi:hypothetical protein